jgi:hypothetical protein
MTAERSAQLRLAAEKLWPEEEAFRVYD